MAGKAENMLPFNSQAVKKAGTKHGLRTEWRIEGVRGLVLIVQPSGVATWYYFYSVRLGELRKLRKVQIGGRDAVSLADARTQAEEMLRITEKGGDPVAEVKVKRAALTFEQLAEKFIAECPTLAASTRAHYAACYKRDANPVIGPVPASEVTADHIVAICKRIEATGAMTLADHTKTAIGGCYRWALRERLVSANPCTGIGRRSHKVARTRTPTGTEIAKLWKVVTTPTPRKGKGDAPVEGPTKGNLSDAMSLIVRLAIVTGQRRTEVAGARVEELEGLDGDVPIWVIPGDVNKRGKLIEGRTKGGREQRLPLSHQAAALFREAIEKCSKGAFVFPADMSKVKIGKTPRTPHIHGDSVTMAMSRLRADAEVEDVSIHDMRRAVSNWLKDEGVSREVRDLILNHSDPSVTEAHYSQSARMTRQVLAAMQAWADHVWQITGQYVAPSNVVPLMVRA